MKKLQMVVACLLLASSLMAQAPNNLFWAERMKPKPGKALEFEKVLVEYAKNHAPNLRYRVYQALTGEHTGSYYIIIGPVSYAYLDTPMISPKGKTASAIDAVAMEGLCDEWEIMHSRLETEISMLIPTRKLSYLFVTEREYEPGSWEEVKNYWAKLKMARSKVKDNKYDYALFRPSFSGNNNRLISARYVTKLAELDTPEPLADIYEAAHGKNSFYIDAQKVNSVIKSTKQEIRVYRPDLSNNK